jgi:tRNA (guanine-N7-)-methyltransferase
MRIRTHTNPLNYRQRFKKLNAYGFSTSNTGINFEIGFGQETFILDYAQQHPTQLIVGAEVKKKAVTLMQGKIDARKITNLLVLHGNGHMCLEDMFDDHTLNNIFIFHPDPWMKRRHYNRRVINEHFLALVFKKLKPTGKLYISTDVESLWKYINEVIVANNKFTQADDPVFWQEFYATRWTDMCREKQRTIFYETFRPK